MHSGLRLAPLFLGILAGLSACASVDTGTSGSCGVPDEEIRSVDPDALVTAQEDGELSLAECEMLCNGTPSGTTGGEPTTGAGSTSGGIYAGAMLIGCSAVEGDPNAVSCHFDSQCIGGRRPAGLRSSAPCRSETLGTWFAAAAHLEAASVPAFERLRDELRAHGAPEALVLAAERAADDERRHATAMEAAALRHGAPVTTPEVAPPEPRSLLALALENAVEGCVKETWAALLAAHQAEAADDPEVRAVMAAIAADETRHAELAWAIDDWLRGRLDPAELAAVEAARRAAAAGLRPCGEPPAAWVRELGLPQRARGEAMWRALTDALWAA